MIARMTLGLCIVFCIGNIGLPQEDKKEADKVIIITADWKYVEEGKKKQAPVDLVVGESVMWKNMSKDPHTATSDKTDGRKEGEVFKTGDIKKNGGKKKYVFDMGVFERAGGKPGGFVEIKYHCDYHEDTMNDAVIKLWDKKKNKK